jgi:NAD(P) transhydrogenase subunit alpha
MKAGIPKETHAEESRVAIVPDSVPKLAKLGLEVVVERGAGIASGFADTAYEQKGAKLGSAEEALACPLVLALHVPGGDGAHLARGTLLACLADPLGEPERVRNMAGNGLSCIALELIPRISRAQAMDVLSSMANVAGYKAVLLAATRSPKLFPMMMTAAGTIRPAKVFVLGVGVAGLQAIATARRLGAVVEAFDIRPETREQVESLGARFVALDLGTENAQTAGGYARELTEDEKKKQSDLMADHVRAADVVVTTAQVPGRKAPRLIHADVVRGMKPGAVIVDMAAESGGNCELTVAGEEVDEGGVIVLGPRNLPGTVAASTSMLYSNNLTSLLGLLVKEGELVLDREDEIIAGALVCHDGEVTSARVKELLG